MDLSSRRTDHGRGAAVPGGLRGGDTGLGGVCYKNFRVGGGGHTVALHVGGSSLAAGEAEQPEEGAGAALSEPHPPGKPIALPPLC